MKAHDFNGHYSRDPNIEALKRSGFINHGSTLATIYWGLQPLKHPAPASRVRDSLI